MFADSYDERVIIRYKILNMVGELRESAKKRTDFAPFSRLVLSRHQRRYSCNSLDGRKVPWFVGPELVHSGWASRQQLLGQGGVELVTGCASLQKELEGWGRESRCQCPIERTLGR